MSDVEEKAMRLVCENCGAEIPEDDGDAIVTFRHGEEEEFDFCFCYECREGLLCA